VSVLCSRLTWQRLSACGLILALGGCAGPFGVVTGEHTPLETALGLQIDVPPSIAAPACAESGEPASTTHRAMLDALNLYRLENGLQPLVYSKRLEAAADAYVQDLWDRSFFDHIDPEGRTPGDRAVAVDFCHPYVGENLAAGQTSVQAVMEAWKNSPTHDKNLLEPNYVYVGMGHFVDPNGRQYWAQEFAFHYP
jgi:uncharacterized protein YkwD